MVEINEALDAKTPMGADLAVGVEQLSLDQEIIFTQYVRLVLPLDNYVFWVKAAHVGPSALVGSALPNKVKPNQFPNAIQSPTGTFTAKGSLHYATDLRQEAGEYYAAERIIFTAEEAVNDLSAVAPGTMWIGEFQGKRFAFSSRSSFYKQADLFHYVGFAIYPDMETQIIDDLSGFDASSTIVSNSLPAWLALNSATPVYGFRTGIVLFPSFLSPQNEVPPFGTVDIAPELTRPLAMVPTLDPATSTHTQLCADTVRITLWGLRNAAALDFVDAVLQYMRDFNVLGLMNMPVIRDEKRLQPELGIIAQKKTVEFECSYLQHRINDVAIQMIRSAKANFSIGGNPL